MFGSARRRWLISTCILFWTFGLAAQAPRGSVGFFYGTSVAILGTDASVAAAEFQYWPHRSKFGFGGDFNLTSVPLCGGVGCGSILSPNVVTSHQTLVNADLTANARLFAGHIFSPYAIAGAGPAHFAGQTKVAFQFGAGLAVRLPHQWQLRPEIRGGNVIATWTPSNPRPPGFEYLGASLRIGIARTF